MGTNSDDLGLSEGKWPGRIATTVGRVPGHT